MATATAERTSAEARLRELLAERIVVLDGAWGTMLQGRKLEEADYRGERFADHTRDLKGDPDLLNLTQPEIVLDVHRQYLAAGADITTTNTFTATSIGQADYGLEACRLRHELRGRPLARQAADEAGGASSPGRSGRSTRRSRSRRRSTIPAFRSVTFDEVRDSYAEQIRGLRDGGADFLLLETIIDALNAKAAIVAAQETAPELPLWISVTIIDRCGRTLAGQTLEAFWLSIEHAKPLIVGLNCSLGATEMRPHVEELARIADTFTSCYPNAGLPNAFGDYDEQPHDTSRLLKELGEAGLVNVVGGCCGTTPEHTRADRRGRLGPAAAPGSRPPPRDALLSGLEPFELFEGTTFTAIGERTNVTGSARFRSLIEAGDYQAATDVALEQVRGGANILDVNMDADLLDSEQAMTTFLNILATEPEAARLPVMIDSSRWSAIQAGLRCVQGKPIVNSISLKEGEEDFLAKAREARQFGAALVVMAFDEQGQADTVERKVEICGRAYDLLVAEGIAPEDLIFDPNVLAVATGMEEHNGFAKAFIDAVPLIKERCPGARISGGISNLSFAFRGNEPVREAIHSAFLYHAIAEGLDMGIVNAGQLAGLRGHPARPARARRGHHLRPPPRRDRAHGRVRGDRPRRGHEARGRPLLARGPGRGAALVRARPRRRRLHRGGHRGGAPGRRRARST